MGVEKFERRVNEFLLTREVERIHLSSFSRVAQGMNLLDYRVIVRYFESPPKQRLLQVKVLEEGYHGSILDELIDQAVAEKKEKAPGAELVDFQAALYEVEPPGRGMVGKDFVQLAVYLLVFSLPVERTL